MLEELFYSGQLEPGQKIFSIVPESGRFLFGYMQFTVCGTPASQARVAVSTVAQDGRDDPIDPPDIKTSGTEIEEGLVRQLARAWIDFESQLNNVPIVKKIREGRLTVADYRELLFNLRQQVIDGSRWISRLSLIHI